MASSLTDIATEYRQRYGDAVKDTERLRGLYKTYEEEALRAETNLLDAVSAAASLQGILWNDHIEWFQTPPQVKEAFERALPGKNPVELINELNELGPESRRAIGYVSTWKGTLFEIEIRDKLNDGDTVGDIKLIHGQKVELPKRLNEPGVDLLVRNHDGSISSELQAKASKTLRPVKEHLERYPDVQPLTMADASSRVEELGAIRTDISSSDLRKEVEEPFEVLDDSPLEGLWENVGPFAPGVLIAVSEGRRWLVGRQTLRQAMERSTQRAMRKAVAMGVGGVVAALPGPNVLGLPVVTLTRVTMDRITVHGQMVRTLEKNAEQVRALLPSISDVASS